MSKMKKIANDIYNVKILKMELTISNNSCPMVSIWFKIVSDGEYKGSIIFMNQVITQGFQIHIVNELLRMMTSEMGNDAPVIEFKNYKQYGNLIMDVFEAIDNNFEYALNYKKGKGDFSKYEITGIKNINKGSECYAKH